MKTPQHWEKDDDWHCGVCNSCLHNSHEKVKMVRQKIKVTGSHNSENEIEVWLCPICGYCREL